jgi:hypothetical protein
VLAHGIIIQKIGRKRSMLFSKYLLQFFIAGEVIAPTTGTPHLQISWDAKRLQSKRKWLEVFRQIFEAKLYLAAAYTNAYINIGYCQKDKAQKMWGSANPDYVASVPVFKNCLQKRKKK